MAPEITTKVRLVRCPKCRLVLPELPEFTVYKCGGCGATLQAKNRVNNSRSSGSGSNDVEAVQENQTDRVHEDKEELSSSSKDDLPSLGECPPSKNNVRDQSRSKDCEDEKLGGTNLSSENHNDGSHQRDSSDCDNEGSEVSNEIFSPTEFVDHKNEEFGLNDNDETATDENVSVANKGNGELTHGEKVDLADNEEDEEIVHGEEFVHDEKEDCACEEIKEFNEESSHDEKEESATQNENEEPVNNENESSLAGAELEVPVNDDSSPLAEANAVDTNKRSDADSDVRTSNAVNSVAAMENGSSASAPTVVRVSVAADTLLSSHGEPLKQPRESIHQGYGNLKSEELNPSSELSGTLINVSKSPTGASHAYDGSISSYDGLNDQFPTRHSHSLKDTYKGKNFLRAEERPRRDKVTARTMMNRESEMQHQARPPLLDKKGRARKNGNWDREKFLEPARHDRTVQNWRLGRHEHQPSSDFHWPTSQAGYEIGGPSNRLHNQFHRRSSFQSRDLHEDHVQVMKLLKMVFEMHQIDKSRSLYGKENDGIEGFSRKARFNPRYNNYEAILEERFRHSDYPGYYGRYGSGINYSNRNRLNKVPFSGEATRRSHQVDPSCSHCFPQDWPRSEQLLPPSHYDTSGPCRAHPGHNYCTSYSTCPSSPQWSVDSEYPPWGREMQSDDRRRRTQDMTNYLRDKHRLAKRHFRPIAGGAPFIVCYKCSKLLQLPADFLLFKKKFHRLRCGACSEVLKFSLENGSCIVPYTADSVDTLPPRGAEDLGDEIDRRNAASTSQALQGDSVSCSDDYGLSCCKSCSTEGDPMSTTPFHTPLGRRFDKRILYGSSDLSGDSKELAPEQCQARYKNSLSRYESSGPSSNLLKSENLSPEIEKLPLRSTSPLHRLMGYSSPSEVIFGSHPSGQGTTLYSMQKEESGN